MALGNPGIITYGCQGLFIKMQCFLVPTLVLLSIKNFNIMQDQVSVPM